MITTVVLADTSIMSHNYHFLFVLETFQFYSVNSFQEYNMLLLTIITMLYVRFPELHLPSRSLYPHLHWFFTSWLSVYEQSVDEPERWLFKDSNGPFPLYHFCRKVLFQHLYFIPASYKSLLIQTIAWIPGVLVLLRYPCGVFTVITVANRFEAEMIFLEIKWLLVSLPVSELYWILKQSREHHSWQLPSCKEICFQSAWQATSDSSSKPTCQGNKYQVSELPKKSSDEKPFNDEQIKFSSNARNRKKAKWRGAEEWAQVWF